MTPPDEIRRLAAIKNVVETAELLLASRGDFQKTMNLIVERALEISGADRSCLIIKNKKGELVIKTGLPAHVHGIGESITPATGEAFLRNVMGDESIALVTNPSEDRRVAYMKGLVTAHKISAMLFLPLSLEGESIGVLVFDWVEGKKISKDVIENIKLLGRLASTAIGMEYKGRRDQERILEDERLRVLGEHSSQVAHIIRNSLLVIGGFSGRLLKNLTLESKYGSTSFDSEFLDDLHEDIQTIDNESKKLERIVNDILTFTALRKPVLESYSINKFLEEELGRIAPAGPRPVLRLSRRLDGVKTTFDRSMLSVCLTDLIRYSVETEASKILIKTKLKPKQREVTISVITNGKPIHPNMMKDIFSPFVTTEINGSGLGLANVQSIINRHGGSISVLSGETTEFRITLPLIKI
jgi:signal transduction histidine kinase